MSKKMNARCKIKAAEDAGKDPKVINMHWVASQSQNTQRDNEQTVYKNRTLTHNLRQPAQEAKPQTL